ncbi:hypothetical protein MRX96_049340 [Rhipicephalus microplus]
MAARKRQYAAKMAALNSGHAVLLHRRRIAESARYFEATPAGAARVHRADSAASVQSHRCSPFSSSFCEGAIKPPPLLRPLRRRWSDVLICVNTLCREERPRRATAWHECVARIRRAPPPLGYFYHPRCALLAGGSFGRKTFGSVSFGSPSRFVPGPLC